MTARRRTPTTQYIRTRAAPGGAGAGIILASRPATREQPRSGALAATYQAHRPLRAATATDFMVNRT
jgi:hypothetical protein